MFHPFNENEVKLKIGFCHIELRDNRTALTKKETMFKHAVIRMGCVFKRSKKEAQSLKGRPPPLARRFSALGRDEDC